MKTLLILRHAKSSWNNARLSDHQRPLNQRGRQDAPRMGRLLRTEELVPDLIISSTAERALATAEAVALSSGYEAEIRSTRLLYHAEPEAYLDAVRQTDDARECVMVVGHNPGVSELLERLTGDQEQMPTAALAQILLPIKSWRELNEATEGQLVNLWRPRELTI